MTATVIQIRDLSFRYGEGQPLALSGVNLTVEAGERCLLVGANGAGKTTLLRIIGGRHMIPAGAVRVLGRPAFEDTSLAADVALLGGPYAVAVDVRVGDVLQRAATGAHSRRLAELVRILGVDPDWRMHRISDGQRRRVQLALGLVGPSRVLLLDEITTDLDLVGRVDLLAFLRRESEDRGAAILYATHIFDRLEAWATDLIWLREGRVVLERRLDQLEDLAAIQRRGESGPLSRLVEGWLRGDPSTAA